MPHIRPKKKPTTPAPTAPLDADAITKRTNKDATPHHPLDVEDWRGFFPRIVRQTDALSITDIERLIRFWTTYPDLWTKAYSRSREPKDRTRVSLERQYSAATRLLRAETEKRAMDSQPLEIAADVCRRALDHHRLSRDTGMAGTAALPERLPVEVQWRDDEVAALTRAKALLARLSVVLSGEKKNAIGEATRIPREYGKAAKTPQVAESTMEYDAFLCHASEDKDAVVRPFADMMREHGLKPWLDEREINWGQTLAKRIQEGLASSRFVVVFLSSAFLSKKGWTDKELNTALSRDDGEDPLVLPVVLGITHEELEAKYPLVSAKLYREIPDYDPAKQVPPGELNTLVDELKNMIGVSDRRSGRVRP